MLVSGCSVLVIVLATIGMLVAMVAEVPREQRNLNARRDERGEVRQCVKIKDEGGHAHAAHSPEQSPVGAGRAQAA